MMLKKQKHITGFLALLICASLGLSTVHTHEPFEWNSDSHAAKTELPAGITKDTNLCPVDGYLFGADVIHPVAAGTTLIALEKSRSLSGDIHEQPSLLNLKSRSPPVRV